MLDKTLLLRECQFKAVRSSGAGGQHVNKVSTKIELSFNVENSFVLNEEQKEKIKIRLAHKLTKDFVLMVTSQDTRSQLRNKEKAIFKLLTDLNTALKDPKKRRVTRIPKGVKIRRLKSKRLNSERKINRRKPDLD